MSEVVIRVENISKLYRLGEVGTGSLAHDVNRWWHKVRGKEDPYLKIGEVNDRTKSVSGSKKRSLTTEDTESTTEHRGRCEKEQPKVGPVKEWARVSQRTQRAPREPQGCAWQAMLALPFQIPPQASLRGIPKIHRLFALRMPHALRKNNLIRKPSTLDARLCAEGSAFGLGLCAEGCFV